MRDSSPLPLPVQPSPPSRSGRLSLSLSFTGFTAPLFCSNLYCGCVMPGDLRRSQDDGRDIERLQRRAEPLAIARTLQRRASLVVPEFGDLQTHDGVDGMHVLDLEGRHDRVAFQFHRSERNQARPASERRRRFLQDRQRVSAPPAGPSGPAEPYSREPAGRP